MRYASACSGLDLPTVALEAVLGGERWEHVCASERQPALRRWLRKAYGGRGLRGDRVHADAASRAACEDAVPADIWFGGPPCGPWSKRNRHPSVRQRERAAAFLDRMLDYVRVHQPAIAILESLDRPANRAVFDAAILSLRTHGYEVFSVPVTAEAAGPMVRDRRMWLAVQ